MTLTAFLLVVVLMTDGRPSNAVVIPNKWPTIEACEKGGELNIRFYAAFEKIVIYRCIEIDVKPNGDEIDL